MNTLEELKNYVSQLFDKATEKDVIEKAAVVSSKIDEIAAEQKSAEENYNQLLKDYKDVVLHSSFKPLNDRDTGAYDTSPAFDADQAFKDAFKL